MLPRLYIATSMNSGHDGSISTGHGNSCRDMLRRLETMVLMAGMELPIPAVRGQIASGLDVLVHLSRMADGSRRLVQVEEVLGLAQGEIQTRTIYEYAEEEGTWRKRNPLEFTEKLHRAGIREQ